MSEYNSKNIILQIERIYIKNISFTTPNTPKIFQEDWKPEVKTNLNTSYIKLTHNIYEVILNININVNINNIIAFLCDVHQAGIFVLRNIIEKKIDYYLHTNCPNILFPYAHECVVNLITKGSFPQIYLAPINFDVLFNNHLKQIHKQKN